MDFQNFKEKYQKIKPEEIDNSATLEPLVSVCVQTYQHGDFIKDCLDGILMQEANFPYEILLGEDESTDGTREICVEYAKKYPDKIRLFLHHRINNIKINGQPTGRFNFIYNLYNARGKYIAFCEGDDYWTDPLKLQKQVDFLEANPDYSLCFHKVKLLNQDSNTFSKDTITREVSETTTIEDLAKGNYIHTPSVVLRNNFKIPEWIYLCPVGDWTLYMLIIGTKKIKKLDDVVAVYRIHSGGIWSLFSKEYREKKTLQSIRLIYKNLKLDNSTKEILLNRIKTYEKDIPRDGIFVRFKKFLKNET